MTDLCDDSSEDPCGDSLQSFVGNELIVPAVSVDAAGDQCLPEDTTESDRINEEKKRLSEEITKKKCGSPGFISFGRGGLICGRLSKDSKRLNEYTRAYHVSFC